MVSLATHIQWFRHCRQLTQLPHRQSEPSMLTKMPREFDTENYNTFTNQQSHFSWFVDIKIPLEFPSFGWFHMRCTKVQHINKHTNWDDD